MADPSDFANQLGQAPSETVGELILYRTAHDALRVEVLYEAETFWLDQRRMAELFGVDVRTVSYHLREIYVSGELAPEATLRKIWRVQVEGTREVRREIEIYHLDAIISVGYRVNSSQATQFRIWATQTLREFVIKGLVPSHSPSPSPRRFRILAGSTGRLLGRESCSCKGLGRGERRDLSGVFAKGEIRVVVEGRETPRRDFGRSFSGSSLMGLDLRLPVYASPPTSAQTWAQRVVQVFGTIEACSWTVQNPRSSTGSTWVAL